MNTADYTAGLRALADFYDAHPDLPLPSDPEHLVSYFSRGETTAEAARIAQQLGTFEKTYSDSFLTLTKKFGPTTLKFMLWRSGVCERRVVGTKTVTRRVPVDKVIYEDREVEEEIVEWDCPPLLKGESND